MAVVLSGVGLKADRAAARAGGTLMEPVTIGIKAILDVVFFDLDVKVSTELLGFFPSSCF